MKINFHIEICNLYYNGINAGESFYNFIVSQRDSTFEQYLIEYLPCFDADTDARLDTLTNKNIKYLFYRYNDFLKCRGLELSNIVHTNVSTDEVVMENVKTEIDNT